MRLGVVGMLPEDFRTCTPAHMAAIAELQFTGFGCHLNGELAFDITDADCEAFKALFNAARLEIVQFSLTYNECLFDHDPAVRETVIRKIARGIMLTRQLGAQALLIRPGSLNPAGPWTPHPDNHRPDSMERLIATLRAIAAQADAEHVLLVLETHATSIVDTPEVCRSVCDAIGSPYLQTVMDPVNHFQTMRQVYDSSARLHHIFDIAGSIGPIAHIKDIIVENRHVLHLSEAVPGEGMLDLGLVLRRFQALYPDGYGLIEHLPLEQIPTANANVRRIAATNGVPIT